MTPISLTKAELAALVRRLDHAHYGTPDPKPYTAALAKLVAALADREVKR